MTAPVFNIYKGTTTDGPGMRDTVFLKGCPLSCEWCHNPEGMDFKNSVWYEKKLCIGCGECIKACNNNSIFQKDGKILINYDSCMNCFYCADVCPTEAISKIAQEYTPDELLSVILKDKEYFDTSGGGVTLSGGEATAYPDFSREFFRTAKKHGINTALDTCGYCNTKELEKILKFTDIILYDLKCIDDNLHKRFTGKSNKLILENLLHIVKLPERPTLWIRTPVIPRYTAYEPIIKEIALFMRHNLNGCVSRWELCAFNNMCRTKYEKLGQKWGLSDCSHISKNDCYLNAALSSGIKDIAVCGITA